VFSSILERLLSAIETMKRLIILLLVLCLSFGTFLPNAHAVGFTIRHPGVVAGNWLTYDLYSGNGHSTVTFTVNSVIGTSINYTEVSIPDADTKGNLTIATFVQDVTSSGATQFPPEFVAANLDGGPILPGSGIVLIPSFFGHILLGQWRATNYWDIVAFEKSQGVVPQPGVTQHYEYDRASGALISVVDTYNDAGLIMTLKATNIWSANPFWFMVGLSIGVATFAAPYIAIVFFTYLGSFLFVAVYDWMHVRSARKRISGRAGMNGMYKMIIIMAVITAVIMISIILLVELVILPLVLG
jgi:hypothetical protein